MGNLLGSPGKVKNLTNLVSAIKVAINCIATKDRLYGLDCSGFKLHSRALGAFQRLLSGCLLRAAGPTKMGVFMAKILIMEDDEFQAEVLQVLMEDLGHQAESCHSAREALSLLTFNSFDLLLTDLIVLGVDEKGGGVTLIKEIRESKFARLRSLPIIAITGSGRIISPELLSQQAEFVGANRVILKPVDLQKLRTTVGELLAA